MAIFLLLLFMSCTLVMPVSLLCKHFYSILNNRKVWESLRGKFALVTNATSDIGKALCQGLTEKGVNLVMIDTNEHKLADLRTRLTRKVKVVHYAVDIGDCTDFSFLEKYDIGLLINKIGFADSKPQYYIGQNVDSLIDSYVRGPFCMMKSVLTSMIEKHKGYVVNIGLAYSIKPRPHFSFMAAVRLAYRSWSESMYYEMMPFNVNVEYMDIGATCSQSSGRASLLRPSPDILARCIIDSLGSSYFTVPYFPHLLQYIITSMVPGFFIARVRSFRNEIFTRSHQNIN